MICDTHDWGQLHPWLARQGYVVRKPIEEDMHCCKLSSAILVHTPSGLDLTFDDPFVC
jgi:hypothetical protein